MNLRVYTPEVVENEKVLTPSSERVIQNLYSLQIEYHRNVAHATFRSGNGTLVTESFELEQLYPDGLSDFLFVAQVKDRRSALGRKFEEDKKVKAKEAEEAKVKLANQKGALPEEKPTSHEVPVASAVGHLVDPTTQDTSRLVPGSKLNVPDPTQDKQGLFKKSLIEDSRFKK